MSIVKKGSLFVVVTILWTWCVLLVPILWGHDFDNIITKIAYILAGASPSVIGFIFVLFSRDRKYVYSTIKRVYSIRDNSVIIFFLVLTLVPLITILSGYVSVIFTQVFPDYSILHGYKNNIIGILIFAVYTLIFGPLAEEIGWRGYLMDCWKDKGILIYGVGIGFIWTIWHLPMFFIDGTYQYSLILQGVIPVICFFLSTIALGVIVGYFVKKSDSILIAILFHFTINFTGELIPLSLTGEIINTVVLMLIAIGFIFKEVRITN